MSMTSSISIIPLIIGGIIGIIINLIPTIIAFIKGNFNKIQVLLLNIIPWGLSIAAYLISSILFGGATVIMPIVAVINIIIWVIALVKAIRG